MPKKHILKKTEEENFPFETIANEMNLIENNTRTLYVETNENINDIYAMKKGYAQKKEYRKLGLYSINIYEDELQKLIDRHSVFLLNNGNCILEDSLLYSEKIGLDIGMEMGQAIFI